VFLVVFYGAIVIQFSTRFFDFSGNGVHIFLSIMLLLPIPVYVFVVPLTLPTYTMIIHVGQLVDLKVVQEAIEKANRKAQEQRKKQVAHVSEDQKSADSEEDFVPSMTREQTILTLSGRERLRYRIAAILFGDRWEAILPWICIIDLSFIGFYMTKGELLWVKTLSTVIHQVIAIGFVFEFLLKWYSAGTDCQTLFKANYALLYDSATIVINFVVAVLCSVEVISLQYGIVVMLRLLNVLRVPHVSKVMLEDIDRELGSIQRLIEEQEAKYRRESQILVAEDESNRNLSDIDGESLGIEFAS
jgi:hypothetical protein